MNGKVEFTLKPVTGSAGTHGGFRAEVATGKGDVVGIDGVIAEAINYDYVENLGDRPRERPVFQGVCASRRRRRSRQHCQQPGDLLRVAGGAGRNVLLADAGP